MDRFTQMKSQISGDFIIDNSTNILIESIKKHLFIIMEQQNLPLNQMNLQQLEERLSALNKAITNGAQSEEVTSLLLKEKQEIVEHIQFLRGE